MMEKVSYASVLLAFLLICHGADARGGRREFYAQSAINASTARHALHQIARSPVIPTFYDDILYALGDSARPCLTAREEPFRRVDGTCNNLNYPLKGAVLDTEKRLFPNAFLDGRRFPRTRGADFSRLPDARAISRQCFGSEEDGDGPGNTLFTQLLWQFGQMLAHDISLVESLEGMDNCCDEYKPCQDHPDLHRENGICFPIDTPNDPVFDSDCMPFARSFGVDVLDVREFVNAVTSYIDLSVIYGSTQMDSDALRLHSQGLLRTLNNVRLPIGGVDHIDCRRRGSAASSSGCPVSGDIRIHDHQGLGAMHTMFHLEHNRIATQLFRLNRHWDDELLFQVARKILIAFMQKITYEDYLPIVLGDNVINMFHLNRSYHYDDNLDSTACLEFSTASFRFGHSMINSHVNNILLHEQFFIPINDDRDIPAILFSQARNTPLLVDNRFTDEVREFFYVNVSIPNLAPEGVSFDLPARNIQRGRDHGIPTYATVRDRCREVLRGLPGVIQSPPSCFVDGVYRNEMDIDLFVGSVSETPLPNSLVGPTSACIIAMQFEDLKFGDRFFYEGSGIEGFTDEQREVIRRTTLASLLCELDPDASLQRNVFRSVSHCNPLVPCRTILEERDLLRGLELF